MIYSFKTHEWRVLDFGVDLRPLELTGMSYCYSSTLCGHSLHIMDSWTKLTADRRTTELRQIHWTFTPNLNS